MTYSRANVMIIVDRALFVLIEIKCRTRGWRDENEEPR